MENIDTIIRYAEDSKNSRFIDYKKHLRVCGLCGELYGEHVAEEIHKNHPNQKFHEHPQKTKLAIAFFVLIGGKLNDKELYLYSTSYKVSCKNGTTPG
jgi:hypothetical protein